MTAAALSERYSAVIGELPGGAELAERDLMSLTKAVVVPSSPVFMESA